MKTLSTLFVLLLSSCALWSQTFTSYTTEDGLLNNNVSCVAVGANNEAWFGTQSGLSKFDGTSWTSYQKETYAGMADDNILSIYVAENGNVWIGTDFGASVFDGSTFSTFTADDGLGNDKVQCVGEDADGTIWFGTITGLASYNGTDWKSYGTGDGLPFGGINSITLHSNGDLWLGTGLSGIAIFDGTDFTEIDEEDGLVSDKIRAVSIDANDNKWVATADGLSLLNADNSLKSNYTRIFTLPEPDTLNPIEDVAIGNDGVVWAAVYVDYLVSEGGVCAYNGSQWFEFDIESGLAGPVVRALAVDGNNNVWVATSTGVTQIADHSLSNRPIAAKSTFALFPNPASGQVQIQLTAELEGLDALRLFDTSMKLLLENKLQDQQTSVLLPLDGLAPGLYFLQVGQQVQQLLITE